MAAQEPAPPAGLPARKEPVINVVGIAARVWTLFPLGVAAIGLWFYSEHAHRPAA